MGSTVLSLRIDGELLDRLRQHAARRQMTVQDYVVRTLVRDDFDERFKTSVDETERFYGPPTASQGHRPAAPLPDEEGTGAAGAGPAARPDRPRGEPGQVRPSAGIA
ncbi:hypothetical protein NPS70_11805 [Streptomyces sp. C10-9-1]|uniref:hypothetical protein n=1 Tax=Streptomyces sp. C10-9-1 TaxID=1859285 RepID=UPI00211352C5|nr:hypothetical protein [Streptomyces sp. C10-9-1]MCQ6553875.1 hypothetical protein [Streptomyces sp. C10-9-1]